MAITLVHTGAPQGKQGLGENLYETYSYGSDPRTIQQLWEAATAAWNAEYASYSWSSPGVCTQFDSNPLS